MEIEFMKRTIQKVLSVTFTLLLTFSFLTLCLFQRTQLIQHQIEQIIKKIADIPHNMIYKSFIHLTKKMKRTLQKDIFVVKVNFLKVESYVKGIK